MKSYKKHQSEVEAHVSRNRGSEATAAYIARYVGGVRHEKRKPDEQSQLRYHGLSAPAQKDLFQKGFSFAGTPNEFQVWDHIYRNSDFFETKSFAFHYVKRQKPEWRQANWTVIKNWVHHVDNWAHSDELSQYYAEMLEHNYKKLKGDYELMRRSQNPWLRRQSLVGMLFYSRLRKKHPPVGWMLQQVKALLDDPHYYVQKAVGWALREIHNVAPQAQEKFVKAHLRAISPTAWYAASENYSVAEKKKLALQRKIERKDKRENQKSRRKSV